MITIRSFARQGYRAVTIGAVMMIVMLLGTSIAAQAARQAGATQTSALTPSSAVTLNIEGRSKALMLDSAAALKQATSLAGFTVLIPLKKLPMGLHLQRIDVTGARHGTLSPLVTLWYVPSGTGYGFRLHEQAGTTVTPGQSTAHAGNHTVAVTTSLKYVFLNWKSGSVVYSLDNTTSQSNLSLQTLLSIAGMI